jgi:hypothetical protein
MFYKNGFALHMEEDVDTDVIKKIFSITDTATGRVYDWDISPYRQPTTEEFASRVAEIIEAITE